MILNNVLRVHVTDRHCHHLRRKIKFGTKKNHRLAKTSGEKISPELPATELHCI